MTTENKLLEGSLLTIWNNRDADERAKAMEDIYAADMSFYESPDGVAIKGHAEINELIARLQSGWAPDFRFQIVDGPHINHEIQFVSWNLGTPGQPPVASGMDIAIIKEGKISSLHLFLETAGA